MPDNPLWMFRPFLSPAPLPLEVISQLQEPMKALQMWLFFSLLLVGAIFDCQKRLIPTYFDPDAVFGTHVCTDANDDWVDVYAGFDWKTGRMRTVAV